MPMFVPMTIETGETVLHIQCRSETNVRLDVRKPYRHLLTGNEQLQFDNERVAYRAANHLVHHIEDEIRAQRIVS